jgi:hypothetical protein
LFTLTVSAPKGKKSRKHTLPFALCFKKENHQDIFIQLLKEVRTLQEVRLRYWGEEKQFIPTIVMTDMVSNDWPERCANSGLSDKGLYHKRWQYYSNFNKEKTPACRTCDLERLQRIIEYDTDTSAENMKKSAICDKCLDWWTPGRDGVYPDDCKTYPIGPGAINLDNPTKGLHSVKLSFPLLQNSIKSLETWYFGSNELKKTKDLISSKYLQMIGFSTKLGEGLIQDFDLGIPALDSDSYPMILKEYENVEINLKQFGTLPMHMMALGVEKSQLKMLPIIVNRRNKKQNELWHSFTDAMQKSQSLINTLSVDWCLSMSFSGKDKHDLGTANWRSDHYLAFTRLSLFHFGGLEDIEIPDERKQVLQAFKRVHVVWFCLLSCVLTDDPDSKVSPTRIGDLVKLFLSSCNYLWESTRQLPDEEECPQQPAKKKRKKQPSPPNGEQQQPTEEKKKNPVPFFVSKSNYFSLLNIEEMTRYFGDAAGCWEGDSESYIQNIKKHIAVKRNNTHFLTTVLGKLLRDHTFAILNEGNPNNQDGYSRLHNFKVYKGDEYSKHPSLILENEDIVVGVIDSSGKMFICVDNGGEGGISLYEVSFDDSCGVERYCLWYSQASLTKQTAKNFGCRDLLLPECADFFLMLRSVIVEGQGRPGSASLRTVICRSWRVRNRDGELALPKIDKKTMLMNDEK